MSLLRALAGSKVEELRKRMERSIKASESLSKALQTNNKRIDKLVDALDKHRVVMEELVKKLG